MRARGRLEGIKTSIYVVKGGSRPSLEFDIDIDRFGRFVDGKGEVVDNGKIGRNLRRPLDCAAPMYIMPSCNLLDRRRRLKMLVRLVDKFVVARRRRRRRGWETNET